MSKNLNSYIFFVFFLSDLLVIPYLLNFTLAKFEVYNDILKTVTLLGE